MTTTPTTPTTPALSADAVGIALYVEASRDMSSTAHKKYCTQVLIMPEYKPTSGTLVPMTMYRRRISELEPRKTWRHFSSPTNVQKAFEKNTTSTMVAPADSVVNDMIFFLRSTFDTLTDVASSTSTHYSIVGEPIVVEVTAADMEDVRLGKTPYKVFGRVWKCRKKLGFPTDFL
jgi:hypothetical protein